MNMRLIAVRIIAAVIVDKQSLTNALGRLLPTEPASGERALIQVFCYGVLRYYPRLQGFINQLLKKPLPAKDIEIYLLLILGAYQLLYMRLPTYAVVTETVAAASRKKPWSKPLINAVLRNLVRRYAVLRTQVQQDPVARYAHPQWLLQLLQSSWPDYWETIAQANNRQAPLSLRINLNKTTRPTYLSRLMQAGIDAVASRIVDTGITLKTPVTVDKLPGFNDGEVSVQDLAAQLAVTLMDLKPGQRVLDACAAPGGKTGHILESAPGLEKVIAIDCDQQRLQQVTDNLQRLNLTAELICADVGDTDHWWDKTGFDRILLDAPCSATGVIRRHPDIKYLRRSGDIAVLAKRQQEMLNKLWPLLKPDGVLLYATCSVLAQENEAVLTDFIRQHKDAKEWPIIAAWGRAASIGRQILPGDAHMDGFYYARLRKC